MSGIDSGIDSDMVAMLRTSLRHVLTEVSDRPLAQRLDDLGWDEVVTSDPATALQTMFEIKGETLSSAAALGPELARVFAVHAGDAHASGTVVGLASPFGASRLDGDTLHVEATALSVLDGASLLVPLDSRLAVCPSAGLTEAPMTELDENFGAVRVTGIVAAGDVNWIDGDVWPHVVAHGRWLVACELVGIARHVIATAVEYTGQRVQYGKPIGEFQALQHRIASAHALVVGAGHLATEAGRDGDEWTALVAKCMAGSAAEFACTQAQQCYGAIGFTWEHEFHRYLRRTYTLDRLFGDWRSLEHEIGNRLQLTGVVPRIGSL